MELYMFEGLNIFYSK